MGYKGGGLGPTGEGIWNTIQTKKTTYDRGAGLGSDSGPSGSTSGIRGTGIGRSGNLIEQVTSLKRPLESTQNPIQEDSVKKQKFSISSSSSKTMTLDLKEVLPISGSAKPSRSSNPQRALVRSTTIASSISSSPFKHSNPSATPDFHYKDFYNNFAEIKTKNKESKKALESGALIVAA